MNESTRVAAHEGDRSEPSRNVSRRSKDSEFERSENSESGSSLLRTWFTGERSEPVSKECSECNERNDSVRIPSLALVRHAGARVQQDGTSCPRKLTVYINDRASAKVTNGGAKIR